MCMILILESTARTSAEAQLPHAVALAHTALLLNVPQDVPEPAGLITQLASHLRCSQACLKQRMPHSHIHVAHTTQSGMKGDLFCAIREPVHARKYVPAQGP